MQGSLPFPDTRRGLCLTFSPPQIFILPLSIPYHSGTRRSVLCLVFFILPQIKMTAGRAHQLSKTLLTEPEQHTKLWRTVSLRKRDLEEEKDQAPYRAHRQQPPSSHSAHKGDYLLQSTRLHIPRHTWKIYPRLFCNAFLCFHYSFHLIMKLFHPLATPANLSPHQVHQLFRSAQKRQFHFHTFIITFFTVEHTGP